MRKCAALTAVLVISSICAFISGCQVKEVTSAKVYIQQDNWEKAMEQLQLAVDMYPQNAEAWFLLGQGYSRQNDFDNMNMAFNKSLAAAPNYRGQIQYERERQFVSYFNNGHKRATSGMYDKAIEDFTTCIKIDPERAGAYKNLGYTYVQLGDMGKAIENYKKASELDPKDTDSMRSLSSLYLQQEKYQETIDVGQKILEVDPTDVETIANMAIAYDFLGDRDKAFATYDAALKLKPDDVDLIFNLGRLYFIGGEYDKAIAEFKKVVEKNPEDFDANLNVGNGFMNIADEMRKKWHEEVDAGKKYTEQEEAEYVQRVREFYLQAIPYLEKAVQLDSTRASAWYNLGVAYINCNMPEKGKAAFDKYEELSKEPPK